MTPPRRRTGGDTSAPSIEGFAARIVAWQRRFGRHDLPWQRTRDPYRVWLSEVMLQQTQVTTVLRYYAVFLARFPDVAALAAAPLEDVLAAWSGLGYYRRAKLLHRCAQVVIERHGGCFPSARAELETLPGIGRSTAAAIAAFCFGERTAILDGNVKRVLARVLAFADDLGRPAAIERLWAHADALLPHAGIEAYTQGLMDLGSQVCTARGPRCDVCPVAEMCLALAQGRVEDYPRKTRALRRSARESVWLWLAHRGRVLLVQRPAQGIWASLWSLTEWESFDALADATRGWPGRGEALPSMLHVLTHLDWTLHPRRWTLPDDVEPQALVGAIVADAAVRWVTPREALTLGLPVPWRRLFDAA
jgi:A/G-specific adenine glycosylase